MNLRQILSRPLLKNSFVYVACDGINRAIPFLLLPLITYYLTTEDYGIVTNFGVITTLLMVLANNIAGIVQVMYFKVEQSTLKGYISNVILINTVVTLGLVLISMVASDVIYKVVRIPLELQVMAIIMVWFMTVTRLNMDMWRCQERPLPFGIYQISQSLLNSVTTILFVVILLMGWKGRVYSQIVSTFLFGAISFCFLIKRKLLDFRFNRTLVKTILAYALPLLPYGFTFWFRGCVSKILLTNMCDLSANGLYSVALTWSSIVTLFITAISNVYMPYFYKKMSLFDKDKYETMSEQIKFVKMMRVIMLVYVALAVFACVVSYVLIKLMYAPAFHASVSYLPWVMLGVMFDGFFGLFSIFPFYTLQTKKFGIYTFLISVLSIGLSWALILLLGSVGAAVSTAITSIAMFIFVVILATRMYELPWIYLIRN
jgi:O-antigen/teichoic acid export membrane protein